jgi:hypothetical protein
MIEELAAAIHAELCGDDPGYGANCKRFRPGASHHEHYTEMARVLFARLEPMIGAANVEPVTRIVLDVTGP